jgi:NADPH:quinone reductase-like Zn-dependent oxidoreductase
VKSHVEAASVPVVAVTVWQALFDHALLKAGQTVVIHGAAGSVGSYAVQLARRAGVQAIATVGTDDISFVRDLGANVVFAIEGMKSDIQGMPLWSSTPPPRSGRLKRSYV